MPNAKPPKGKTVKNLLSKKHEYFEFDAPWVDVFEHPESNGLWLIYGAGKHGKTWFALKLAQYLDSFEKTRVIYISAEEGTGMYFAKTAKRAGLYGDEQINFYEWLEMPELEAKLNQKRAPKVVFIDNATVYYHLKYGGLRYLLDTYPRTLFVLIAHEEKKEPYGATAKLAYKLAKIIVRVEGAACYVGGRCEGGTLMIDEHKARLYHGQNISANG